jgi:hypothetical protein
MFVAGHQHFGGPCCFHLQCHLKAGSKVLRNVGIPPQHYTASQPRRPRFVLLSLSAICYGDEIEDGLGRAYSMHGEITDSYKILIGSSERKRQLSRCRWETNIKRILKRNKMR